MDSANWIHEKGLVIAFLSSEASASMGIDIGTACVHVCVCGNRLDAYGVLIRR